MTEIKSNALYKPSEVVDMFLMPKWTNADGSVRKKRETVYRDLVTFRIPSELKATNTATSDGAPRWEIRGSDLAEWLRVKYGDEVSLI